MRKFTLFLALIVAVLFSTGQNSVKLQKRVEAAQEKYSRVFLQNSFLASHSKFPMKLVLPSEKTLKSAAATMKLDSTVTQEKSSVTGEWEKEMKDEYVYNAEMKNTMWLNSDWDESSGTWEAESKTEIEFNPDGSVSAMRIFESSEENPELKLSTTVKAFYNEAGQLDSVQHWFTENEQTKLMGKQVYEYNESGKLIEMEMWSLMEEEGEESMSVMRHVYTYTATGKMETSSSYFMLEDEEVLFSKTNYNYDGSDKLTFTEDSLLSFITFQFEKSDRTDYDYNSSGDISTETYSDWNPITESWEPYERDEYTYNSFNNPEVYFPSYLLFFGIAEEMNYPGKAVDQIVTHEMTDGTWNQTYTTKFYYSNTTNTFADEISEGGFSVYPNPAREMVTFNWNENRTTLLLEIYQVSGSRILEKQISSGVPVSLSNMNDGMYFFRLNDEKQTIHKGKLIKR